MLIDFFIESISSHAKFPCAEITPGITSKAMPRLILFLAFPIFIRPTIMTAGKTLSVVSRRYPGEASKGPAEGKDGIESTPLRNLRDRKIRLQKQATGFLKPETPEMLPQAHARLASETRTQMTFRNGKMSGKFFKTKSLMQMKQAMLVDLQEQRTRLLWLDQTAFLAR
jgi:hypothetical protein